MLPRRSAASITLSFLPEHTNEDWIRYQLNDGRNVLLNIYDVQSVIIRSCSKRHKNVFGIMLQDAICMIQGAYHDFDIQKCFKIDQILRKFVDYTK